jgi:stage V sporulation protein R
LLRQIPLTDAEAWDIAALNGQIVAVQPPKLNPYRLGYLLYRLAEDHGGRTAVQSARTLFDDVGLVRAYGQPELVGPAGLALYAERDPDAVAREASPDEIWRQLLQDLDHAGLPRLRVEGVERGVWCLKHWHDGRDLDFHELPQALKMVAARIWGGPVRLVTIRQGLGHLVEHDGRDWLDQVVDAKASAAG